MAGVAKQLFDASEVALHSSRKDCWVAIGGKVSEKGDLSCTFLLVHWGRQRSDSTLSDSDDFAGLSGWFQVYDVTKFLEDHPGGEDVLLHASGRLRLCSLAPCLCFSFLLSASLSCMLICSQNYNPCTKSFC